MHRRNAGSLRIAHVEGRIFYRAGGAFSPSRRLDHLGRASGCTARVA